MILPIASARRAVAMFNGAGAMGSSVTARTEVISAGIQGPEEG